jgi:Ca2+-binding RTX toxin-like protein
MDGTRFDRPTRLLTRRAITILLLIGTLLVPPVAGVTLAKDITCAPGSTAQAPCQGTKRGDDITGTTGNDYILAKKGKDSVDAQAGNDVVFGGPGDDVFLGGQDGTDDVYGEAGNDEIFGGS